MSHERISPKRKTSPSSDTTQKSTAQESAGIESEHPEGQERGTKTRKPKSRSHGLHAAQNQAQHAASPLGRRESGSHSKQEVDLTANDAIRESFYRDQSLQQVSNDASQLLQPRTSQGRIPGHANEGNRPAETTQTNRSVRSQPTDFRLYSAPHPPPMGSLGTRSLAIHRKPPHESEDLQSPTTQPQVPQGSPQPIGPPNRPLGQHPEEFRKHPRYPSWHTHSEFRIGDLIEAPFVVPNLNPNPDPSRCVVTRYVGTVDAIFRPMAVVRHHMDHMICVPVSTYGGRGLVTKTESIKDDHLPLFDVDAEIPPDAPTDRLMASMDSISHLSSQHQRRRSSLHPPQRLQQQQQQQQTWASPSNFRYEYQTFERTGAARTAKSWRSDATDDTSESRSSEPEQASGLTLTETGRHGISKNSFARLSHPYLVDYAYGIRKIGTLTPASRELLLQRYAIIDAKGMHDPETQRSFQQTRVAELARGSAGSSM